MNIPGAELADQYAGAIDRWPWLHDVEPDHGLPRCLLLAVGSRETGLLVKYTQGATGDGGHGHGLFQLDDRWHIIPAGFDTDPWQQAVTAAEQLAALFVEHGDWLAALNAYNSGSPRTEDTTGGDYGPDVLERRAYLAGEETPVPDLPTAEKALDWLRLHIGTEEYPPGSNRNFITEWAGLGPVAWCDECFWASESFAWGVYDARQLPDDYPLATDYAWGDAYVPSTRHHLRLAGRYGLVPTKAAAVVMVWPTLALALSAAHLWSDNPALPPVDIMPPGPPEITRGPKPPTAALTGLVAYEDIGDHIGRCAAWIDNAGNRRTDWPCVEADWDGTVITYEGNTGDALLERRRPMSVIDGFGQMLYPSAPQPPLPTEEAELAFQIVPVHPGEEVSIPLPQQGNDFGWSKVSVTLTAGPQAAEVRAVIGPDWHGLDPDHPEDLVIPPEGRRFSDLGPQSNVLQVTNYDRAQSVGVLVEAK